MKLFCRIIGVIFVTLVGGLPASGQSDVRPEEPDPGILPAEWREFPIDWKATWDETYTSNQPACTPQAVKDPALLPMASAVAEYRRIWLLESLMARFPADRARHIKASIGIAEAWQRLGQQYWRSVWGVKLLRNYPDDPEAVRQGYQFALGWAFGQYVHWGTYSYGMFPESREFAFLIPEILEKNRAGKLPDDHPAVITAYGYQSWLTTDLLRYDEFHPFLATLRAKGGRVPFYLQEAVDLLARFGHVPVEKPDAPKAGGGGLGTVSIIDSEGNVRDVRAGYELETRWELLTKGGALADGSTNPIVAEDVQKVLDLIVGSPGHLRDGNRYSPFWNVVDRRLRELPAERLQPIREWQERMGKKMVRVGLSADDRVLLLRAFSRYPFSPDIHRSMVEAAELDLLAGRIQWAVMAYEDVIAHSNDPETTGQARTGLWLALAQSALYRKRLEKAMAAVPDGAMLPWRGGMATAGQLKRDLLAGTQAVPAPGARPAPATLAELPRRRIALPADWPAGAFEPSGPEMAWGIRTPWPVTRAEIAPDYTLLGCVRAVARFNVGADKAAWRCTPASPEGMSFGSIAAIQYAYNPSPFNVFFMQRRPVNGSAAALRDVRFYLQEWASPPVVAAVDIRKGEVLWTTEGRAGWEGLTPLTRPAVAAGQVFLLAGPRKVERLAELGFDDNVRVVQQLVCLDAVEGEILWRRPVGWVPNSSIDLARGGGAVAIHDGSVYSATSMGILARHDANDGSPEWVTPYAPARQYSNVQSINCIREGSTPLVCGDKVLLAPRDHTGVLAFQRERGGLIWETVLVPSDRLVGVSGSVVIGANSQWLCGLNLETGKPLWIREFPRGIASQAAILTNGSVVVVSAGRALRLAVSTGQTIEELDLQAGPDAEFIVGEDGTLVDVTVAPLAPEKGPATFGRPMDLPLKKVWSFACECPALALRSGSDASTDAIGVLAGRRLGMLRTRPRWEMTWQRRVADRPQAITLAGNRLLTAYRWTLTSYDSGSGTEQWGLQLPLIPVTLGGDDQLVYAMPVGGNAGSSYYAGVDPVAGKVVWKYSLNWDPRFFGNGTYASAFRRLPDGTATLTSVVNGPGRVSEVTQDAATGRIRSFRPVCPSNTWCWGAYTYDSQGLGWIGSDHAVRAVGLAGEELLTAGWQRTVEFKFNLPLVNARDNCVYLRLTEHLLRYDPATKTETDYNLAPGEQCSRRIILEFRRLGDRLLVVSGDIGGGVYADLFEYGTAKRLGHQALPGVTCCVLTLNGNVCYGYDTRVVILDGSVVVTDVQGVHVFANPQETNPQL